MVLLLIMRRVVTNPLHFMINEVAFGEEAFIELKSILPDSIIGKSMTDYHLLLAKRKNQGRRMNHLVGIVNLSKMTLTNEFLVTKTFADGNQADTNLISVQNTRFMMYLNNKNLLELNDDDVLMIFLLHGNLDYQKFRIVGKQQYFKIDDTILEYLRPMIFDTLIFGGKTSPAAPKALLKDYFKAQVHNFNRRKMSGTDHSFSQCSMTLGYYQSNHFKDSQKTPGAENDCDLTFATGDETNIDGFAALSNIDLMDCESNLETKSDYSNSVAAEGALPQLGREVEVPVLQDEETVHEYCPNQAVDVKTDMGKIDLAIDSTVNKIKDMFPFYYYTKEANQDHIYSKKEWNMKYTSDSELVFMGKYLKDLYPLNYIIKNLPWFQLIPNYDDPEKSHYR